MRLSVGRCPPDVWPVQEGHHTTTLTLFPLLSLPTLSAPEQGAEATSRGRPPFPGEWVPQEKPASSPETSHVHRCHRVLPLLPHQLCVNTLPTLHGGTQDHPPHTKAPAAGHGGVFTGAAPYLQSYPAVPSASG